MPCDLWIETAQHGFSGSPLAPCFSSVSYASLTGIGTHVGLDGIHTGPV